MMILIRQKLALTGYKIRTTHAYSQGFIIKIKRKPTLPIYTLLVNIHEDLNSKRQFNAGQA